MNDYKGLGKRLKAIRNHLDYNQKDFSKIIGVSKTALSGYETEYRAPEYRTLIAIISSFKINGHWLLTGEGDMFFPENNDSTNADYEYIKRRFPSINQNDIPRTVKLFRALENVFARNDFDSALALLPDKLKTLGGNTEEIEKIISIANK